MTRTEGSASHSTHFVDTFLRGKNIEPEPWFVQMVIEPTNPSPGSMTANHSEPSGGTFSTEFMVQPKFVFSEDLDFTPGAVEFMGAPVDFDGTEAAWLHPGHPLDANTPLLPAGGFHAPELDPIPWYGIFPVNPSDSQFIYAAAKVPEPSTLVLCCLGLVVLIVRGARYRRSRA